MDGVGADKLWKEDKIYASISFLSIQVSGKPLGDDWLWDDFISRQSLRQQKIGDMILPAADRSVRPIRLPLTDKPAILALKNLTDTPVRYMLRHNGEGGEVLGQGVIAKTPGRTELLLKPAASTSGGMVNIYYLTLEKEPGSEAHIQANYRPGYL